MLVASFHVSSLVKWFFLPLLRVESYEGVVWLHLDPTHLISDIDPAFRLEELGGAELGAVIRHVVEHVEEHGVGEGLDRGLRQTFGLAHVVTLRNADVNLEAVIVVSVAELLALRRD